jgi:hypothetical protein
MPLELNVPVPRMVDPFRKATSPVGVLLPDLAATLAVKVTLWPVLIAFVDAVSDVVVATWLGATVTVSGLDVDVANAVAPP